MAGQASWWAFVDMLPDPTLVLNDECHLLHHNPAFEKLLGWSTEDIFHGSVLKMVPEEDDLLVQQLQGMSPAKAVGGIEATWLTKTGRKLKVTMDAVKLPEPNHKDGNIVLTLKGLPVELRSQRIRQILLRMSKALHRYRKLDRLLSYVTRLIQVLMKVGGTSVIFLDSEKEEFYFYMASYDDQDAGRKLATIRFPADKGVAGEVYRTGKPLIVADYAKSPYAFKLIDEQAQYETRNMLDVPLRIKDRMIGVLCTVNKRDGAFDQEDIELLSVIADVVALPIENARVNEALQNSYERVKTLNKAKERVILHLSHELKTPLAVLSASLKLLENKISPAQDQSLSDIYQRAQRNLQRLLEMEYAVEDILRQRGGNSFDTMTQLPQQAERLPDIDASECFFQQVNMEFLVHELKDPLSVIESNTRLIAHRDEGDTESGQFRTRCLSRIQRGADKIRSLLGELLEVGRAEAVCFNCHSFSPVEVIQQVLIEAVESHAADIYEKMRSFDDIAEQMNFLSSHGIRLESQAAAETVLMVQDETKFRQIVSNLMKNALTYRRHLLLINLTCHRDDITLSVRDDGPGVAEEHKEKIFERYTQVSPFPEVARSGHGLGLAVSRILARSMDGDITLDSQLGQGAVFRLRMPIEFDKG